MAYFRKRTNGWEYRISYKTPDGKFKLKTKSGFRTKSEAVQAAAKAELDLEAGLSVDNNIIFADYFIQWATLYKKPNIRPETWKKYEYTHKKIEQFFKDIKLNKVTSARYQNVINNFQESHSFQTVRMFNTHIKQCIKFAIHDGLIQKDFTALTLLKNKDKEGPEKFLELEDYFSLIRTTKKNIRYKSHFCIYLISVTGMRFSEAMGLTKDDIDWIKHEINIDKTFKVYGAERGFAPTKNKSSIRTIPIDQETTSLLKDYLEYHDISYRLFENLSNSAVNKALKKLTSKDTHVHSLRHTYASYLISKQIDILTVSNILGHKDLTTTLTIYTHLLEDSKNKNSDKIRKLFRSNLGQEKTKGL